jgi:O-antigen/teichoic acid export membrane protein
VASTFGSQTYGIREVAGGAGSEFLATVMGFQLVNAAAAFAALALGVLAFLGRGSEGLFIIVFAATLIPGRVSNAVRMSFFGREDFLPPVLVTIGASLATLLLNLPAVFARAPLLVIGAMLLLVSAAAAAAGVVLHRRQVGPVGLQFNRAGYVKMMKESLPYFLVTVLGAVHMKADVLFVRGFIGKPAVGLYGVSVAIINLMFVALQSLQDSLFPAIAREGRGAEDLSSARALRTLIIPLAAGLALAFLISLSARPLVLTFFGEAYAKSVRPLVILSGSLPFLFVSTTALRILLACGRTKTSLRILAVNCAVNIAANVILIPGAGIRGAAAAAVISSFVSAVQCVLEFFRRESAP